MDLLFSLYFLLYNIRMNWEQFYNFLGIRDFIYFISSPQIQETLLPVKLVFIAFTIFFLIAVIYFLINSSYLNYKFVEDITEFLSWQSFGLRQITKRWNRIKKRVEAGSEAEYKLALIEADDFLNEVLEDRGYEGKDFEDLVKKAGRLIVPSVEQVLSAHKVRNSIVYDPDFKLDLEEAKKILAIYEAAVNNVGAA